MKKYLDIVENVLENGVRKAPVRKNEKGEFEPVDGGIKTIGLPNIVFSHNMWEGFPLLTSKKMATKAIRVELEGFLKGVTDKRWFQERGCNIWNEWANNVLIAKQIKNYIYSSSIPRQVPPLNKIKEWKKLENDLGPIYGYQWRRFDEAYSTDIDGLPKGADQVYSVVETLKNNYNDRRMVVSAWNPNQNYAMALKPCHISWNVCVYGDRLNLCWKQRSCDLMLGVPFNIASYAFLLLLLCEVAKLKPGNLTGVLVDCHIYENQIESAREQLTREPRPLPKVEIVYNKDEDFDIFKWTHKDVKITNYNPHPKLNFGPPAV